jgi:hypothetical protein
MIAQPVFFTIPSVFTAVGEYRKHKCQSTIHPDEKLGVSFHLAATALMLQMNTEEPIQDSL